MLELPFGVKTLNPQPEIAKYFNQAGTPYTDVTQALTELTSGIRHIGLTVNIAGVEYWFKDGVADIDLVVKNNGITSILIREQFEFTGSQIFTLVNNYAQVYAVMVQGQGSLHTSQYDLLPPNQVEILDTLDTGDYIIILYSDAEVGVFPYYTQAEVDALIAAIPTSTESTKTLVLDVSGDLLQSPTIGTYSPKSYTIPANTISEDSLLLIKFRISRITGSGNPFITLRYGLIGVVNGVNGYYATRHIIVNDTTYRHFPSSGTYYGDLDTPTTSIVLPEESIDRTADVILDLELNFSTALTDEFKLEFLLIQQIK